MSYIARPDVISQISALAIKSSNAVILKGGKESKKIEEKEKYAQPDTGAIHLLLKNLDPSWHNDDKQTMELKREQTEIMKQKAEAAQW